MTDSATATLVGTTIPATCNGIASINDCGPTSITFGNAVTVHQDGRVEVHEGIGNDEAAIAFWDAVRAVAPGFLKQD